MTFRLSNPSSLLIATTLGTGIILGFTSILFTGLLTATILFNAIDCFYEHPKENKKSLDNPQWDITTYLFEKLSNNTMIFSQTLAKKDPVPDAPLTLREARRLKSKRRYS